MTRNKMKERPKLSRPASQVDIEENTSLKRKQEKGKMRNKNMIP